MTNGGFYSFLDFVVVPIPHLNSFRFLFMNRNRHHFLFFILDNKRSFLSHEPRLPKTGRWCLVVCCNTYHHLCRITFCIIMLDGMVMVISAPSVDDVGAVVLQRWGVYMILMNATLFAIFVVICGR